MKVLEYQKKGISLETLPLHILRGIDIETPDEEKIIQELVNRRLKVAPIQIQINRANDKTDFKSPAEEAEFQKIIDARIASARPKEELNVFCNFCSAKGPISHQKICTRNENKVEEKLIMLKEQRASL